MTEISPYVCNKVAVIIPVGPGRGRWSVGSPAASSQISLAAQSPQLCLHDELDLALTKQMLAARLRRREEELSGTDDQSFDLGFAGVSAA